MRNKRYWIKALRRVQRWTLILSVVVVAVGMLSYMTADGVNTLTGGTLSNEGQLIADSIATWLIGLAVIHLIATFARSFIEPQASKE